MIPKTECCGCSACAQLCPQKCIIMREDKLGFLYPEIIKDKCVNCGLCEKTCPVLNKPEKEKLPKKCWGGHADSEKIRKESSSGGLFTLFAESTINDGGVVFGARLSADRTAVFHDMVESIDELYLFRGSKYVQSNINDCYTKAKEQLLLGRKVLFSGTPCQIDGLRLFLNNKFYSNLLTIEVICHGTPSPKLYQNYIHNYIEKKLHGKVNTVNFRDEDGGNILVMNVKADNGKKYRKKSGEDPYYRIFLNDTALRESCYQCPSKGLYYRADITLSDFWGVDNMYPELNDGNGVSLVLLHNDKAVQSFEAIVDSCTGHEVDFERAISGNMAFFNSYPRNGLRDNIEKEIDVLSFEKLAKKYGTKREYKIIKAAKHTVYKLYYNILKK